MTRPKVDIALLPLQIIDAVGNHHTLCQTRNVMIKRVHGRPGGECAQPIQMANHRILR
jgi:hypothetical protein